MKKRFTIAIFLSLLIVWWTFWAFTIKELLEKQTNIEIVVKETNTWTTASWEIIEEEIVISPEELKKQKIEALRKKLTLRWLIIKWDVSLKNGEYTSALVKYLQIHKEIPNDLSIISKLWDTYYNLKKYKQAYSYYSQAKEYSRLDKNKVAKTLIFSVSLTDENIEYLNNELNNLWLSPDQLFYYQNSLVCKSDFSLCKQAYQDYFIAKNEYNESLETWTWEIVEEISFEELDNIETALENYENFQVDDLLYKWALVSWAFFENGLYPIAIETSKKLLEDKSDYKPLLKIAAKSYYELWDYINAKLYLIDYNKLVKNDPEASYFLWIVYEKLHEYILSSIHFKKALKIWYENSLDINRRILFNYYELWDIDKMLEVFKEILTEDSEDLTANDFNLAIYYHIVNEDIKNAKIFTRRALEIYPESEIFNWYMWWILMDEVNSKPEIIKGILTDNWEELNSDLVEITENANPYEEAEIYIKKGLEVNAKSPMLNLVMWKLEVSKWDIRKAFIYFKKTVSLDKNWDFWKIAKQELENIEIIEK